MQMYGGFLKTVAGAREGRREWKWCRKAGSMGRTWTNRVHFLLKKEVSPPWVILGYLRKFLKDLAEVVMA